MSRVTTHTGGTVFFSGAAEESAPGRYDGARYRVAIVGDFSGRASRSVCDPATIASRTAYRLGKDNFEQLFERLQVSVSLPGLREPLHLMEFDDLHPDYLYRRVPLFQQFIQLKKRLLTPSEFPRAAEEIQQWRPELPDLSAPWPGGQADPAAQSLLDSILSGAVCQAELQNSERGQIEQLIKSIVAPYVQQKPDVNQQVYLDAVTEAASEAMRKIMHHSDFRQIEANWRSLHLLLRRLEDHPGLELHLIDISKAEVLADLAQAEGDLEQSGLFKCLVERHTTAGGHPYNLILGDFTVTDDERDLHMVIDLATIAEAAGSAVVMGGDCRLAGCPSMNIAADPDDWGEPLSSEFIDSWGAVREYQACAHLALAAPRFLLRLPYGADSSRTDDFAFEELGAEPGHRYYLWGNSAYLLTLSICRAFGEAGSPQPVRADHYRDLPLHLRKLPQGEWLTPCAEAWLSDRSVARFQSAGLSALRSIQGRDEIRLTTLQSITGTELKGTWT